MSYRRVTSEIYQIFTLPPLVRRCIGTTVGQGYLEVDEDCLVKIPPWVVNLCPHYQAVHD
jgi:hypothetical protein